MSFSNSKYLELSLEESNALKGIALILLLIHHLFYIQNGMFDDVYVDGIGVVNSLGIVCKVCVALFVFLSGYGLGITFRNERKFDIKQFYGRRLTKLFFNYWFIWLIFVPVGILIFDRSFEDVYGNNSLPLAILDFFGLLNLTGKFGYNPTWWFYSCIILLYLVFPLIAITVEKKPRIIWFYLLISILLVKVSLSIVGPIRYYLFPFVVGILFTNTLRVGSTNPPTDAISGHRRTNLSKIAEIVVILTLFLTACLIRLSIPYALLWDTLVALLIMLLYKSAKNFINLDKGLGFIGKHSFNIFLFHTFIYYLYFPMLIYWSRNPFIIFFSLFLSSIVLSIGLEKLKHLLGFYNAQNYLMNKWTKTPSYKKC